MFKKFFDIINNLFPYKTKGKNNKIFVVYNGKKKPLKRKLKGLDVIIEGNNCYLEIEVPISFKGTAIKLSGEYAVCIFKKTFTEINRASIYVGSWGRCFIDEDICINNSGFNVVVNNNEKYKPHKLVIGKRVLIGRNVGIRTSDGHSLYNLDDKLPYNEPQDVIIGDDVWLAQNVTVLKGAEIPSNTAVGACSLVNKKFEQPKIRGGGILIAGNPAKVIKQNIRWTFKTYGQIMNSHNKYYGDGKNFKKVILKKINNRILKFLFRFYF